ncbi:restriction endonuclease subunit S [Enterococcus faecalis]|uniref:restriction endonuclease subunit S n=1 Tax=Enterococcus faecalis TaxID=1351 RepID=UPI000CF1DF93|nr:restriction endonuclease subunit S [Enterococcus faecalis]EGO6011383.1 restriction endonuclease subunit S [Enterococcus faecalis]EGO8105885.1 restriction endonuclease subunit S [Enterococcus faecalis]EGO9254162.1 restriction endonuclease subunit S [Enterococcus faecalis]EGS8307028.1 restriction endonuclease subunit S [Enterococcus faecalis]EHE8187457.1 restriction endonuclease subunit S [Enterococcus faecalis]
MIVFTLIGVWEQCKVEELCKISTGKGNTQDKVENGKYPFYVRSENIERSNYFLYDQEAVLTVGDGVGTGRVFHYVSGKYNLHQRVYRMYDFNKQISAKYFYYYFSLNFHRRVRSLTAKTSVDSVRLNMIADMEIKYPSELEQLKIFSFLDYLIKSITLHQRKLEQLKELKKAYLQVMFPAKDERVPKVRFAAFEGEWAHRKLGEITESFSGGTPTAGKSEYYGGDIPFIRSGEISSDSTELFITENGLNSSSAKMVKVGDILYALYGATSGEVGISKITGAINQAILAIRPSKNDNSYLIIQWLRKQKNTIISTYLQGGQGNLSSSIVKNLIIMLPQNKEEQEKVGIFFKRLDDIITLHQNKLEQLKDLKTSYLQNMFI